MKIGKYLNKQNRTDLEQEPSKNKLHSLFALRPEEWSGSARELIARDADCPPQQSVADNGQAFRNDADD